MEEEANARAHGFTTKEGALAMAKERVEELGFEWVTYVPPSGYVSKNEVEALVAQRVAEVGHDLEKLEQERKVGKHQRRAFAEKLRRDSAVPIQDQLLAILTKHRVRVSKIIDDWDIDGNRHISRKEFKQVLMFMGCEDITREESNEIFSMFDEDGAGAVDYFELERKLKGFDDRGEQNSRFEGRSTPTAPVRTPMRSIAVTTSLLRTTRLHED